MGVDIQVYCCRIGMFNCGAGPKLLDKSKVFSDVACAISAIGAVCFIGILLIMAGEEPNPGPTGKRMSVPATASQSFRQCCLDCDAGVQRTHERNNPLCKNWNRVAYGYRYVKTGLAGFVAGQIGRRHNFLKVKVDVQCDNVEPCSGCTTNTLLPDHRTDGCNHKEKSDCLCQQDPDSRKECPNNFCGRFYHLTVDDHVEKSPRLSNADCTKWYEDFFQYAKCFLRTDTTASSVSDLDLAELLTIVIHNKYITTCSIKDVDSFQQCLQDQHKIFHSGNFEVTNSELKDYFDHMVRVLEDGKSLFKYPTAMLAVNDLHKLNNTLMQLSDEDIDELLQKTSESTFVFRFQYLLIEIGTKVIRKLFDVQVGQNFGHHLASKRDEKNKPLLDKLKDLIKKKRITAAQTQYLPPKDISPSSTNFDISLLTCLLRNVCGMRPAEDPIWMLPVGHSVEADIARLRDCRNNLSHGTVFIRKTDFTTKWNELCEILLRLNEGLEEKCRITNLQNLINESQTRCIDENKREDFTKIINAWEKSDADVIAELERMSRRFASLEQEVKQIKGLLIAKITVDTQSQKAGEEAHSSILNAAKTFASDGQEQTCGTEVQTACNNLLSDMKGKDVVIDSVKEGSILITFRCRTELALERIRLYIADKMYQEKLTVLENAVSRCIMCPVKLNISIAPDALMQTDIPAGKKSVVLTFKCRGSEGVKNAVNFLSNGSSNNKMKELSDALSRSVGEDVRLHTTVDLDKFYSESIDQPSPDGNIALHEEQYKKYIFRYKYLLVEIGTDVMRKVFDFKVGFDFVKHLSANHNKFYKQLQSLISAKIITFDQAQHLPPIDNSPKSTNMDITLLACLLRNVCGLRGHDDPVWKNPPSTDFSLEADLARLNECRNNLQHSGSVFISTTNFKAKWTELSEILIRINKTNGITDLSALIDNARAMDIDEELKDRLDKTMKVWDAMDEAFMSKLNMLQITFALKSVLQRTAEIGKTFPTEDAKEHEAVYSMPKQRTNNAIPNLTLPTEKYKRPLPELPEQRYMESISSGTVCTNNCKSKPMLHPRSNKNEADIPLPTRQFRSPRNLDPFQIKAIREIPAPLLIRSPTSPEYCFDSDGYTPPPLPDRQPGPLRQDTKQAEQLPTYWMRTPSPRNRLGCKLPPPPGFTDTNNLLKCVWYHGKLEPGSGIEVLANEQHGSFLVRDSNNNTEHHKYTLEFRDGNKIKKLMIVKTNDKYHFREFQNETFSSVVELVETMISTGLVVKDTGTHCWKTIQIKPAAKYKPT